MLNPFGFPLKAGFTFQTSKNLAPRDNPACSRTFMVHAFNVGAC